ncbi:MAG: phage holin family protein [Oscillospiraceae bacterium]|nr:phage holin family protein [Oscillospiraceae bacterium]
MQKYLIMLLIVVGLAISDWLTGNIKAHIKNDYKSSVMRAGLLHKASELLIMITACGFELGIEELGKYYENSEIGEMTGLITAGFIFVYIVFMEIISIFENYAEINPQAQWATRIIKKLRNSRENDNNG